MNACSINIQLRKIDDIIRYYNASIKSIEENAINNQEGRAYGGIVRAGKGKIVEDIAKALVNISWESLGQDAKRLKLVGKQIKIGIKPAYIHKLRNPEVKRYIYENKKGYFYSYKPDILVEIDGKESIEIECKAYTENAMFKRILVDATLLKTKFPDMKFILLQLESQLGGDFSELREITYGSPSTHTLLSHFDIDLHIITLLKGERKVKNPIHKPNFFKPLTKESLEKAQKVISDVLNDFL